MRISDDGIVLAMCRKGSWYIGLGLFMACQAANIGTAENGLSTLSKHISMAVRHNLLHYGEVCELHNIQRVWKCVCLYVVNIVVFQQCTPFG